MPVRSLLFVALSAASCAAWLAVPAPPRSTARALKMTATESSDDSFDGVQVTTKTNKQLIFDDSKGRFFETSNEPEAVTTESESPQTASLSASEVPKNVDVSRNEMVSTEVLFGRKVSTTAITKSKDQFPHMQVVTDILVSDYAARNKDNHDNSQIRDDDLSAINTRTASIVEQCYQAWNQRDFAAVVDCFDNNDQFVYQDTQFLGTITSKSALREHFETQAKLLPPNSQLVLENVAVDATNGNNGAQWHLVDGNGKKVPMTRGVSFYTTHPQTGLITSGFKATEMLVKPSKQSADLLVASASPFLRRRQSVFGGRTQEQSPETSLSNADLSKSIIEQYFDAWNARDMETALECFVEDCEYQTEDPVFVDTFRGKAALRQHLEKNAATLPASCRIVLDRIAQDSGGNGSIGTLWHLEVNGIAIPNLRGCSMYTTDPATGLLKTGFDVTEAPVKVPRQFLSSPLSQLSARLLLGQS